MADQYTKRQHYVPQWLINRFSDDKGMVWCIDKNDMHQFHTTSDNILLAKDYYEIDELPPNQIENGLAKIEGAAASIFTKFDTGVTPDQLTHEEKLDLSIFLASLMLRTPVTETAFSMGLSNEDKTAMSEDFKKMQIVGMINEQFAFDFYCMDVYIIDLPSPSQIILSDCPLLRMSLSGDRRRADYLSISSTETILILPIGPNRILAMYQRGASPNLPWNQKLIDNVINMITYEMNRLSQRFLIGNQKFKTIQLS